MCLCLLDNTRLTEPQTTAQSSLIASSARTRLLDRINLVHTANALRSGAVLSTHPLQRSHTNSLSLSLSLSNHCRRAAVILAAHLRAGTQLISMSGRADVHRLVVAPRRGLSS